MGRRGFQHRTDFDLPGLGREGGMESVLDYTRTKSVWLHTSDAPIPDPFVMR